jgi:hypothetical protein
MDPEAVAGKAVKIKWEIVVLLNNYLTNQLISHSTISEQGV